MPDHKIALKIPAAWDGDDATFIELFHRWIRDDVLPGLMVDVADYRHVPEGPAVMLVGHEYDVVMDRAEGGFGLLLSWKRNLQTDDVAAAIGQVLDRALLVAEQLEKESLGATLAFDRSQLRVIANDRLNWPNDDTHAARFQAAAIAAVADRFGGTASARRTDGDQRQRLGVLVSRS